MRSRKKTPGYVNQLRTRRAIGRGILKLVEIAICVGIVGVFAHEFLKYAEGSTDFRVRRVEIHGLNHLSEHDVLRASGISDAENILFFESSAVEELVDGMPYVRACSVGLQFPDTVILHIEEREPFATLMINSHSYEIDRDGVVLRRYGPTEMPVAPFLTSLVGLELVQEGEVIDHAAVREAMHLWEVFSASPMADRLTISELAAPHADDIRMYSNELPFEMRWGRGNFERQVRRLTVLWDQLDGLVECAEYLDLRFDADLVCK